MDRWRGAFIAVLLTAVLAGCDDAPEPRVADEPTPSSSAPTSAAPSPTPATPSPTAAEPAMPAAAAENSRAGAEAFARWYVDVINYTSLTGAIELIVSVSDTRCAGCNGLITAVDDVYTGGGHSEGGQWSIGPLTGLPLDHGADWGGFAEGQISPQLIVNGDGTSTAFEGGPVHFYAYVAWTGSGWTMRFLNTPEPA